MKKRYDSWDDRKETHLNNSVLEGWLRSCVGKKWDKCYSEFCAKVAAQTKANHDVHDDLARLIQVNTKLNEAGQVVALQRWSDKGYVPIKELQHDYYVCPKDGTVKRTQKLGQKSAKRVRAERRAAEDFAVTRWLDKDNVLRLVDGVWYHFEVKDVPIATITFIRPGHHGTLPQTFFVGWSKLLGQQTGRLTKTWEELNQSERERFGTRKIQGIVLDIFTNERVYCPEGLTKNGNVRWMGQATRYHATKQSASHKQLKQAGLAA
jgi:hypothetical protein